MKSQFERRLAAILAVDVVGYSRLMQANEEDTHARLKQHRIEFIEPKITEHHGRIVKLTGDGALVEFASAVEAVRCAIEIQKGMAHRNINIADDERIEFRIGANLGDVIDDDDDIYGSGVNVAARLEALADPGGILISGAIFDQVEGKIDFDLDFVGEREVKNIDRPIRTYRVLFDQTATGTSDVEAEHRNISTKWLRLGLINRVRYIVAPIGIALILAFGIIVWFLALPQDQSEPVAKFDESMLSVPIGPSIAVLPFKILGDDEENKYFSDGLTDQLIIGLSQFRNLFVIAYNTTSRYRDASNDVRQLRQDLGVDYLLEGGIRRSTSQLRITAKLIDARNGAHIWANSYDRDLSVSDIIAIQDDITEKIVSNIASPGGGVVSLAGQQRAARKSTANLDAYECVLQAHAYILIYTAEAHLNARSCLERAVELDPNYADAWAWLAHLYDDEYINDLNAEPGSLERASRAAGRAIELDPLNQKARAELSVNLFVQGKYDEFRIEAEQALALNPNNASIIGDIAIWITGAGQWERGFALASKAAKLDPYGTIYYFPIFRYYYNNKDYESALTAAQKINLPELQDTWRELAAAYGQLGRLEEATAAVARLLELDPEFVSHAYEQARFVMTSEDFIEHLMDGLRKAGLDIPPKSS